MAPLVDRDRHETNWFLKVSRNSNPPSSLDFKTQRNQVNKLMITAREDGMIHLKAS